jgi:hypothetical protein
MRNALPLLRRSVLLTLLLIGFPTLDHAQVRSRQLQQLEPVQSWPTKAKRWALVIGVDKYADTQITTLGGSSNDAKTLADALTKYAGFPPDQVFVLATDQPAERQPTRGNILRRLSNLAASVPPDGLLLVSFAGHGMERSNQAFLLPSDAQVSNDVNLLELTAINVSQMKDFIRKTGVGQVVLILDACRNDPVGRANADNPLTSAYVRGFNFDIRNKEVSAFATLYATAVGQRAYEFKEKGQGYFTWELIEGLKGGAANERGEVTLEGLLRYVQEHVPKHVLADLGAGKDQKPFAEIGGYRADQLVIAVVPKSALAGGETGSTQVPGIARVDPAAFEISYWDTIKNSTDPEDFRSYLRKYPEGQFSDLARRRANLPAGPGPTSSGNTSAIGSNTERRAELGVRINESMFVVALSPGGPAEVAGVKVGDKIVSLNGEVIFFQQFLVDLVGKGRPGDPMEILLNRNGQTYHVTAKLGTPTAATNDNSISQAPVIQTTPTIQLADIFTLGVDVGMAELSSYQNIASVSVQQYLGLAQTVAARNGIPTLSIDTVLFQLRSGVTTASQYQSLLMARQAYEQSLNRSCNCGYAVNLSTVFTLGAQLGFLQISAYQNTDPTQMLPLLTSAVQFAAAVGLPTADFEDLLRKVRSGKRGTEVYNRSLQITTQVYQSLNRGCSC